MAGRISNIAPPGSLFKTGERHKRVVPDAPGQRRPRRRDEVHLAALRQCPCAVCHHVPLSEAAHVRMTRLDKPNPGIGARPNDCHAVPLCWRCHVEQHSGSEAAFWSRTGIDPFELASALYAASPNVDAMKQIVGKFVQGRKPDVRQSRLTGTT